MSSRKHELLDSALAYLLEHGVANASLRPLAAALGTSPRMLIFHFKSKESLLREVFAALNARILDSYAAVVSGALGPPEVQPLKRFWLWATEAENAPYLRLFYEVQVVAAQNPAEYGRYLKTASADWQATALETLSASLRSEALATLCIAVFDGLFLEFMLTGERDRLIDALDRFIAMAAPTSRRVGRPPLRSTHPSV
jgi:AcrR family transcriptional regulator